ncbi:MAG: UbiA family prenyltransferase [Candidatus Daviesbacteria bacterium]|nr:UbiA family prenyltransferase [Candidatus Daviesbacteria bacterium]
MKGIQNSIYFQFLRINHWPKNIVIFFGFLVAFYSNTFNLSIEVFLKLLMAFILTGIISSANYVLNQIADKKFDSKHPNKKKRPLPSGKITIKQAVLIYILLTFLGVYFSLILFSFKFTLSLFVLWIAGIFYNIKPIRLKDVPYLDVVAESANNPIRIAIGWFIILPLSFPPVLILLLSWFMGAIFMTAKRFDELKFFGKKLSLYRTTFRWYSMSKLRFMLYLYTVSSILIATIIIWQNNKQLLIIIPLLVLFLKWFLSQVDNGSAKAREIESFVVKPRFLIYSLGLFIIVLLLVFINKL